MSEIRTFGFWRFGKSSGSQTVRISNDVWNPNDIVRLSDVRFYTIIATERSDFGIFHFARPFYIKKLMTPFIVKRSRLATERQGTNRTSESRTCRNPNAFSFGSSNRTFGFWRVTVFLFIFRLDRQRRCFNFLFERFKLYYMPNIFTDFNWATSLYRPALELPEVRRFRPGKEHMLMTSHKVANIEKKFQIFS